jgi:hypothetical protein
MQDLARAALVRALAQVLTHGALTTAEKRAVADRLEQKIVILMNQRQDDNDKDLALMAVQVAIAEYRESRGGRSSGALGRELRRPRAVAKLQKVNQETPKRSVAVIVGEM